MLALLWFAAQKASQPSASDPTARWIALGALLVAGVGLLVNLRTAWKDRARIGVSISADQYQVRDDEDRLVRVIDLLHVKVTNTGRRPASIRWLDIEATKPGYLHSSYARFEPPLDEGFRVRPPPSQLDEPIGEHQVANFYFRENAVPVYKWIRMKAWSIRFLCAHEQ